MFCPWIRGFALLLLQYTELTDQILWFLVSVYFLFLILINNLQSEKSSHDTGWLFTRFKTSCFKSLRNLFVFVKLQPGPICCLIFSTALQTNQEEKVKNSIYITVTTLWPRSLSMSDFTHKFKKGKFIQMHSTI